MEGEGWRLGLLECGYDLAARVVDTLLRLSWQSRGLRCLFSNNAGTRTVVPPLSNATVEFRAWASDTDMKQTQRVAMRCGRERIPLHHARIIIVQSTALLT